MTWVFGEVRAAQPLGTSAVLSAGRGSLLPIALVFAVAACGANPGGPAPTNPAESSGNIPTEQAAPATPRSSIRSAQPTIAPGPAEIWQPQPRVTWQWQLTGEIDAALDVQMYDVDLFATPASTIAALHAGGFVVVCYLSAGTYEPWRPDSGDFRPEEFGRALEDWPDERWLDTRSPAVRSAMLARLDLAVTRACDGVEPDNIDAYQNDSNLDLSRADAIDYLRFLAREAHAKRLSIGLKNGLDLIPGLIGEFDWALNESCLAYDECGALLPFIDAGKAVFHVEYVDDLGDIAARAAEICGNQRIEGFSTLVKEWDLGVERGSCH